MKKYIILILTTIILFAFSFPNTSVQAKRLPHTENWKIESTTKAYKTTEYGKWKLIYKGDPAKRKGEYDTISASISDTVSVSGQIELSKKTIASSLGYSYSKTYEYSGSKNSASLKKGEYIRGYVKKVGQYSKVKQRKYIHSPATGNKKTNVTKTAYVRAPSAITLKIDYYTAKKKKKKTVSYIKSGKSWVQTDVKYYV
ncbi:hypothetical protein CW357_18045 [Rummeliibacillus sp. TYF005]|uniref:hypothetical protein n=1 Tax=Rummeliibacillus sp. TYF005 TaxID=2058214 RepID=UPI000F541D75|nr:hypothetical protein [Rummeliibacillus sp. TYF005]RPJ93935.1 hypothetical protein CW357_18045 [Rummeliibacillus sp. TYF005]